MHTARSKAAPNRTIKRLWRDEVNMFALLTEDEVAEQLHVSVASLRRWRLERRGPQFIKVGSLVRYRPEDLETWLAALPTGGSGTAEKQPQLRAVK
jgi:excisionase family DNA binding protein